MFRLKPPLFAPNRNQTEPQAAGSVKNRGLSQAPFTGAAFYQ